MSDFNVAVLPGDGIGPEVMDQAIRVLDIVTSSSQHCLKFSFGKIGGAAFDAYGAHFPAQTKQLCEGSDAILFGSVGGPIDDSHLAKWKNCEANSILALRKEFNLYANLRPAKVYTELAELCPLNSRLISSGIDILIFRELIGDIYFGEHRQYTENNLRQASDLAHYDEKQIAAIAHRAFQAARGRKKQLISVDKANVLATSKLWREIVGEVAKEYPDVMVRNMLVDNCAMQLITNPAQFDVIVTANLFGDILSDAAATLPGSLGLMPSASLSHSGIGLFEPSGGSAPELAGKNVANPIAQILSGAMMLRYAFAMEKEALAIEQAIQRAIKSGVRTVDIALESETAISTTEMTDAIIQYL